MDREKLKLIVRNLKSLVNVLESEVYSDVMHTNNQIILSQTTTKFMTKEMMTDTPIKLISVTPDAEKHMAYCARVSNPNNQRTKSFLVCSSIV